MTYQITDKDLQEVPGCTPLKIYIVLNNSPNGMTAAELAKLTNSARNTTFMAIENLRKSGLLSKNGTIVKKLDKNPNFCKEKEKNQKKEESLTTTSTTTRMREDLDEKEILFSWLTEREDYLRELAKRNGLLKEGGGGETPETATHVELIEVFRPYIEEFAERLRLEDVDIWLKGRHDTLKHFYSWLPKYIRAKAAPPPAQHSRGAPPTLTKEQLDEQLLQKRRRMEKAEELQRQMDEQNRAAENSTQSEGYKNIMARFGHNKPKNNNDKERRQ